MPNSPTTVGSSLSETTGTPIALAYGYNWVTGKRDRYYQLQDTGSSWMDFTRVGAWMLGEGEWDGCQELWINDHLAWRGYNPGPAVPGFSGQQWQVGLDNKWNFVFNFHSGCDSIIGSGFTPDSNGPDQGVDVLSAQFPSAIQPQHFTRVAYYMLMRKQPIENQTNDHRDDPSQWTDINPVGLWRALKVRLFDSAGQMTGYAFTTNPVWHIVDVLLRRVLLPDYSLNSITGPDDLTDAVRARFDWSVIFDSAAYCDEIISNGRRRFEGHYAFSSQTSLQAILEKMLLCCRGYLGEYAGAISIKIDKPRSSVFTFTRDNVMPGWEADDQRLHSSPNNFIPAFRDLLVPAIIPTIASISIVGGRPRVTMTGPHPFTAKDWVALGGTDTVYDGEWQVYSVPAITGVGTPAETDPSTFDMVSKGANYPASVGAGGYVGLLYARFQNRTPEFWHKANQYARGVVGNGIARQRNKVREQLDFATSTYDQVARIASYERDRQLGADTTGTDGRIDSAYITPPFIKLRAPFFAKDKFGNLAAAVQPGDRVTLDSSVSTRYAGEYEVLDGLTKIPPATAIEGNNGSQVRQPSSDSGEIEFPLGPYSEAVMYDASDPTKAGWLNVPGSDPGNSSSFTQIDLVSGVFVFFTGIAPSGSQFQLPSSGFPSANLMPWASPAGANVSFHSASIIKLCDTDSTRALTLVYEDDSQSVHWGGDVAYAAVAWLSSDVPFTEAGFKWLDLTLLGGEEILFGQGTLADGATVPLPAAWSGVSASQIFAVAYMHDQAHTGHVIHLAGARVDSSNVVHFDASDGSGNTWHGNAKILVFAYRNNGAGWATETITGVQWAHVTLGNGKIFGFGCGKDLADGTTITLPATAGDGATLQPIVGSSFGMDEPGSDHAQGVGSSYLDTANEVHVTFNNGSGSHWSGKGDLFAIYCTSGSAALTLVTVSPASATINQGMQQQFAATVQNNANHGVNWSVDGIAGGNVTVGTIDSTGLYTAPDTAGAHTITAASVAVPTATGSAAINVTSTGDGSGGGWLINGT